MINTDKIIQTLRHDKELPKVTRDMHDGIISIQYWMTVAADELEYLQKENRKLKRALRKKK